MWVAFSVDLEPNKDGTTTDIPEAMRWVADTVPSVTFYTTYSIAKEEPNLIADLAADHEIGVHVHPRDFGHRNDQLAELDRSRQRALLSETRTALADATGIDTSDIVAFRAGRHSASETTLEILDDLGFEVDASVNVRYTDYLPESLTDRRQPFTLDTGLVEIPTTFGKPPLVSRVGIRQFPSRVLTATANTLRSDKRGCSGLAALSWLRDTVTGLSMYMHPYDATRYHPQLSNAGSEFRSRLERFLIPVRRDEFVTTSELCERDIPAEG